MNKKITPAPVAPVPIGDMFKKTSPTALNVINYIYKYAGVLDQKDLDIIGVVIDTQQQNIIARQNHFIMKPKETLVHLIGRWLMYTIAAAFGVYVVVLIFQAIKYAVISFVGG